MKNTKRIAAIGLAAMLSGCMLGNTDTMGALSESLAITANAATASGTCGTGLNWSLSGDTLTITGTGTTMKNYARYSNMAPWRTYASQIKKVYFPKTLKSIGSYAFYNMTALEYVYTKDGYNKPCLPDLTSIGDYAFAECYAFYGCTSNGVLTLGLGTSSVMEDGTVTVKDSAFMNCDRVRFLKCNYKTMIVEQWGFARMDALTTVSMSNTKVQLGKSAFNGCSNLATVNVLPSVLPIHNSAFNYTKYLSNGCTNQNYDERDLGAAKKMKGQQLVVNFFVDRTMVDLNVDKVKCLGRNEHFDPNIECPGEDVIVVNNPKPTSTHTSTTVKTTFVFLKKNLKAIYAYGWNAQKSARGKNSVITLNKLDYTSLPNQNNIPIDTVQNGETRDFLGSYVTSDDIADRLDAVRDAMDDFKNQALEYGINVDFEMRPETNFHITYDFFDWSSEKCYESGGPNGAYRGFYLTKGYGDESPNIEEMRDTPGNGPSMTHISGWLTDQLFSSIQTASESVPLTGGNGINLLSSGNNISAYTEYLKNKYKVDGVVYLIHLNTDTQSYSVKRRANEWRDEFSVISKKTSKSEQSRVIEHETAHLYGANDYYSADKINKEVTNYANTYFDRHELMLSTDTKVSPVTAFSIGWLDRLDKKAWNIFFG